MFLKYPPNLPPNWVIECDIAAFLKTLVDSLHSPWLMVRTPCNGGNIDAFPVILILP